MPAEQNHLAHAASPYLRSAAHQPIHWFEWGEAAFAAARAAGKPILLDIGAVWCHWCHVMDRESYDDPAIAEIINQHFIAIKVDRDQRPDVDSRHQAAVSALTGQGGWPLTAFLTPEGKPFYGGTYFPPNAQYGRPSFRTVLNAIAATFAEKPNEVAKQADHVLTTIQRGENFAAGSGDFSPAIAEALMQAMTGSALKSFDPGHGGFGHAPKFPHSPALDFVMDRYSRSGDARLRQIFAQTLENMAKGGVYDQLAGGFHRYSVDERWVVPHFEKMAYDNSELLKNYVHAYQLTGEAFYADVACDIIRWMDEWLSDREAGGFYGSQDADYSLEDDGDYFTWTVAEAGEALSALEFKVAAVYFDINEVGEMHHNSAKNVLYQRASLEECARRSSVSAQEAADLLTSAKSKMYAARKLRPTPFVDKTIYVNWNAMCISAYLTATRVLDLPAPQQFALKSLDRMLAKSFDTAGRLLHIVASHGNSVPTPGFLEDYAMLAIACLDAYEATACMDYFYAAQRLANEMVTAFFDVTSGGFFDTPHAVAGGPVPLGVLTTRRKPFQDSPTPAGNSVAAITLLRLHELTGIASYREQAEQTLELFSGVAEPYGIFAGTYGLAAIHFTAPHQQVVVVGGDAVASAMVAVAIQPFALTRIVLKVTHAQVASGDLPPMLAETLAALPNLAAGATVALLCSGNTCQPPMGSVEELRRALAPAGSLPGAS